MGPRGGCSPGRWPAGDRHRLPAPSRCRCAAHRDRSTARAGRAVARRVGPIWRLLRVVARGAVVLAVAVVALGCARCHGSGSCADVDAKQQRQAQQQPAGQRRRSCRHGSTRTLVASLDRAQPSSTRERAPINDNCRKVLPKYGREGGVGGPAQLTRRHPRAGGDLCHIATKAWLRLVYPSSPRQRPPPPGHEVRVHRTCARALP